MLIDVVWSDLARRTLLDIYVAIGIQNPPVAERWYDRIESRVRSLARHPRMGPRRPDIGPTTRVLVETPYLILYETHPSDEEAPVAEVEIVAIVDGRRDLEDFARN